MVSKLSTFLNDILQEMLFFFYITLFFSAEKYRIRQTVSGIGIEMEWYKWGSKTDAFQLEFKKLSTLV